ncbi:VWA domain-containing protein [Archangium minus]|uniref:VWA domain-containing protein n=1 Tax=Archangium minus TaxID=83450 RepID=A0ABY9X770_9BACT|nr:VWA domain-containing protein [Archangium minus]
MEVKTQTRLSWLALQVLLVAALAPVLGAGEAVAQTFSEEHILIVIDRSGSMQLVRNNGQTRFTEAIRQAKAYVNLPSSRPRSFAVWTFEEVSYIKEQGFADAATTLSTLNRLSVGNGVTPLAYAVCDAVDELLQYEPGVNAKKVVRLVSDGEENSTPSSSQCHGPDSTSPYPNFSMDSWQWKVRNMLKTGDPLRDDPGPYKLVFDVNVLYDYVRFARAGSPVREVSSTGNAAPIRPLLTSAYFAFLQGVSKDSGGTFTAIGDSSPVPVQGDTNQDYCVNDTDYHLVLNHYGNTVPPAPVAADVNRDGVVDYYDYTIVVNNYGSGCGSSPAVDK